MSQNQSEGFDFTDPVGIWRSFRDANLDAWAKAMTQFVSTDTFAQALGAQLDTYLATSGPFQKAVEQYMEAYLANLNMPSRGEVISMARRMTNLEMRIDDMEVKIDQLLNALSAVNAGDGTPGVSGSTIEAKLQQLDTRMEEIIEAVQSANAATQKPATTSKSRSRKASSGESSEEGAS